MKLAHSDEVSHEYLLRKNKQKKHTKHEMPANYSVHVPHDSKKLIATTSRSHQVYNVRIFKKCWMYEIYR